MVTPDGMMSTYPRPGEMQRVVVYDSVGDAVIERVRAPAPPAMTEPSDEEATRLHHLMNHEVICAAEDLELGAVVGLMSRHRIGCIPVVDAQGRAIGMLTKTDLVEHLDSTLRRADTLPRRARELMMPLALTLPDSATVLRAASLMVLEDIHHVLVVSEAGFLAGVVSAQDIVRWLVYSDQLGRQP